MNPGYAPIDFRGNNPMFRLASVLELADMSKVRKESVPVGQYGVTVRTRGYLPHWERDSGTYFVTFRLVDSLPAEVLIRIAERKRILESARQSGRKLLPVESVAIKELSSRRIEALLDAGAGECILKKPGVAEIVAKVLRTEDGVRYRHEAWCVMPNHVHVLCAIFKNESLADIVGAWKSITAREINKFLRRSGHAWQREGYDRLIRNQAEFDRAVRYIQDNPVKAGLHNWPWVYVRGDDVVQATLAGGHKRKSWISKTSMCVRADFLRFR